MIYIPRPKIPVSLSKGYVMPAWFDLTSLDENVPENETSILRAVDNVHAFLDEELAKTRLSPKKIILAGFSQGGALALYSALTYHKPLAGILVLSCWIPLHKTFPDVSHILLLKIKRGFSNNFVHINWPIETIFRILTSAHVRWILLFNI